jgi:2-isopropylmalate synthase
MTAAELWTIFQSEYQTCAVTVTGLRTDELGDGLIELAADVNLGARTLRVEGQGSGPIAAFVTGFNKHLDCAVRVLDYHEHAVGSGADAQAVAYLELRIGDAVTLFGVGIDSHIVLASLKAIVSGVQRVQSNRAENRPISASV